MGRAQTIAYATIASLLVAGGASAADQSVGDDVIAAQRANLAKATTGRGFGPQSPRDIDATAGNNRRIFATAPSYRSMNLCNIHFHKNAEHKGGEFTKFAGNGDGKGYGTGFVYSGKLSSAELAPYDREVGSKKHGFLVPGDTIELHYVHTTAQISPGPTLGACLSDAIKNPQLRVEAQVYVIVNDDSALDFVELNKVQVVDGVHRAINIPTNTGTPVRYEGSTTGPSYNEAGSPLQVTWSVRPKIAKVSLSSVEAWLKDNEFNESKAHGVRNLVTNPSLLSKVSQ